MNSFLAIYRLVLRHQINRGRIILYGIISAISFLLALLFQRDSGTSQSDFISFIAEYGFSLAVPILSLVLATAAVGQWLEDETLVYVWLRPISRLTIAGAATLAALSVTVPMTTLMMAISTAIGTGFDGSSVWGATLGTLLLSMAYTTVFVALGSLVKQSLIAGFVYVFVWEGVVSRFGNGMARLSLRSYANSTLSRLTDVSLDFANRAEWATYLVPLALSLLAVALTTRILQTKDVP